MSTVRTAVQQANWSDIRERSFWTGIQTALGFVSAEAVLLALDAAGVDIPDGWVFPLTVFFAFAISVVKNVVRQYVTAMESFDTEDVSGADVEDETPLGVEDAYGLPDGGEG